MPRKDNQRPLRRALQGVVKHSQATFPEVNFANRPFTDPQNLQSMSFVAQQMLSTSTRYIQEERYRHAVYCLNEVIITLAQALLALHKEMGAEHGKLLEDT